MRALPLIRTLWDDPGLHREIYKITPKIRTPPLIGIFISGSSAQWITCNWVADTYMYVYLRVWTLLSIYQTIVTSFQLFWYFALWLDSSPYCRGLEAETWWLGLTSVQNQNRSTTPERGPYSSENSWCQGSLWWCISLSWLTLWVQRGLAGTTLGAHPSGQVHCSVSRHW